MFWRMYGLPPHSDHQAMDYDYGYDSDYDDYEYRDSFNVIKHYEGTEEFQRTLEEFTEEEIKNRLLSQMACNIIIKVLKLKCDQTLYLMG